jgi:uncharacterized Zn-binding protein involved in type VI secretion
MPTGPAARTEDMTAHGSPLEPGPGSTNVLIGGMPAWRGMSAAACAALAATFEEGMKNIGKAAAADAAAAGTVAAPTARANLVKTAGEAVKNMAAQMMNSGADIHQCPIVKVVIPDGPGVVINGSQTVLINGLPACRVGDMIQEATSVNTIAQGLPTVIIGG